MGLGEYVPCLDGEKYKDMMKHRTLKRGDQVWVQRVSIDSFVIDEIGKFKQRTILKSRRMPKQNPNRTEIQICGNHTDRWLRVGKGSNVLISYKPTRLKYHFTYLLEYPEKPKLKREDPPSVLKRVVGFFNFSK